MERIYEFESGMIVGFEFKDNSERRIILYNTPNTCVVLSIIDGVLSCFTVTSSAFSTHQNHTGTEIWKMYQFETTKEQYEWFIGVKETLIII